MKAYRWFDLLGTKIKLSLTEPPLFNDKFTARFLSLKKQHLNVYTVK